ncbi:CHAP domain-containing protein [Actinomadura sp. ATCC 31491]|uniref:CHAP domain-containing protein n=2 Tax=Actinomadura luzonensis TaxID=2805427 RepID=A0ABT0GCG4_9ACTN|nr:CHAP domain-containing protein [Actinomadura luzonensis]
MFLAWAADRSGLSTYVGEFAWTPSHAAWFMKQGAWTQQPEPGALVFYDWRGGKSYKGIDHVGIVESVEGKKIHTIEANVDGVWLKRKVRETDKVVGYGVPRLVKANADKLDEIRSTEQPFVRAPGSAAEGSPLDVLGTPPALLAAMVLVTVVLSLRFTRRRGVHRRFTWPWPTSWPWNEPGGPEEQESRAPAPMPETFRDKLLRVGSPPIPEQPRPRERDQERDQERERERVRVGATPGRADQTRADQPRTDQPRAKAGSGQAAARHATPARRKPYDPR